MEIKASVRGSNLTIENATIAYGSKNAVSISFVFGDDWADYTQRKAYFRYGQSQSYYADIDENGNVEIPSVVIAPPRFSVFVQGKTDDDTKTIRTDLSTINVVGNLNAEALPADGTSAKILPLKEITQNGTYKAVDDMVDGYGKVEVNVTTQSYPLEVTQSGTYTPKEGYFFDKVMANINSYPLTVAENGTYTPKEGYFFDSVNANIPNLGLKKFLDVRGCDQLFKGKSNLVDISKVITYPDTSNVTDMSSMFYECNSLTSVSLLDTSNVTAMSAMFYYCRSLTSVPLLDTSNVTNMGDMFHYCSSLTSIPLLDTSNVTNMGYMFSGCSSLTSIPPLDTSKVINMGDMFYYCRSLTSILMFGIHTSFDIRDTKLEHDALVILLNNLMDLTGKTSKTLTMGTDKLALLSDEAKKIATDKNWILA
jgi:surface protein